MTSLQYLKRQQLIFITIISIFINFALIWFDIFSDSILINLGFILGLVFLFFMFYIRKSRLILDENFIDYLLSSITGTIFSWEQIKNFRSNIMIFDNSESTLAIYHYFNMLGDEDIEIYLKPGEGAAGKALLLGRSVILDTTKTRGDIPENEYKKLNENLKAVASFPIAYTENNEIMVIGILNFDTSLVDGVNILIDKVDEVYGVLNLFNSVLASFYTATPLSKIRNEFFHKYANIFNEFISDSPLDSQDSISNKSQRSLEMSRRLHLEDLILNLSKNLSESEYLEEGPQLTDESQEV